MYLRKKHLFSCCPPFKQERYQDCENVSFVAGGACGVRACNCRCAVSLSDCSASFAPLNVSLYPFSFTGSLVIQPPGTSQSVLRVTEGEELRITCIHRGSGAGGQLSWLGPAIRQGRATATRRGSNRARLRFSPLIAEDSGTYVCLLANEAATVKIIVHREYV